MRRPDGVALLLLAVALVPVRAVGSADPAADLEQHARTIDRAARTPAGQERVADRLARDLNAAWGRSPAPYSAASLSAQRTRNRWGWGEVLVAAGLAQLLARALMQQHPDLAPAPALAQATAQVTGARQRRVGWSAIASAHGLKLGGLVASVERTARAVERAEAPGGPPAAGGGRR